MFKRFLRSGGFPSKDLIVTVKVPSAPNGTLSFADRWRVAPPDGEKMPAVGAIVKQGDILCCLDWWKITQYPVAPYSGVITAVYVNQYRPMSPKDQLMSIRVAKTALQAPALVENCDVEYADVPGPE